MATQTQTIAPWLELESVNHRQPSSSIRPASLTSSTRSKHQVIPSIHENSSSSAEDAIISNNDNTRNNGVADVVHGNESDGATLPAPSVNANEQLSVWNKPRRNFWKVMSCFFAFVVMGANDSALGALIPYLEIYYHLSYTVVSLVFLSPLIGYIASALLNNWIHLKFGQRGVAIAGPSCHLLAYIVTAVHPPFPVIIVVYVLAGFGNGLLDAAWNAWIGAMADANQVLGFLHGFYGLGAVISPLIATTMITRGNLPWYTYYYIMIGLAVVEVGTSVWAFWESTAAKFRQANPKNHNKKEGRLTEALLRMPAARVSLLCTLFLFCYVGVEVALGGWIVTFMLRVRQGEDFASGMVATGFWMGITVGRVILGFLTPRIGENWAILGYTVIAMALELLFWLVPQFYVSAVAVGLLGFFLGPLFPAVVVAVSKLLPKHLHVSTLGFAAAAGGAGAAVFPFAVGAIAQAKGVQVLQPVVLALLATLIITWLAMPRIHQKTQ